MDVKLNEVLNVNRQRSPYQHADSKLHSGNRDFQVTTNRNTTKRMLQQYNIQSRQSLSVVPWPSMVICNDQQLGVILFRKVVIKEPRSPRHHGQSRRDMKEM